MAAISTSDLPQYHGDSDDWKLFAERLEVYFVVNNVTEEKKKTALLLTSIGDDIYKHLREVCLPAELSQKDYSELCELVSKLTVKHSTVFRERHNFYNAKQGSDESASAWFARIKALSLECKFDDRYDAILLDRFISGFKPSAAFERLCEEYVDQLTLDQALEIAVTNETKIQPHND